MQIVRFEIHVDELENVHCTIELQPDQTFKTLHDSIVKAFNINSTRGATFYICNNKWQKLNEITLGKESRFEKAVDGLKTSVSKMLEETNKFIYSNESVGQFTFLAAAEETAVKGNLKNLPRIIHIEGKLPSPSAKRFTDNLFKDDYSAQTGEVFDESEGDFFGTEE